MKYLPLEPTQIISMNDYPPLHSSESLSKYYDAFKSDSNVMPVPVIPLSRVVPYLKRDMARFLTYSRQLEQFLSKNPDAEYFMIDGTHRATAAILTQLKIPCVLLEDDLDIKEISNLKISNLKKSGEISISGLKSSLDETMAVLEQHYYRCKKFWTIGEKVNAMVCNGDIPEYMV